MLILSSFLFLLLLLLLLLQLLLLLLQLLLSFPPSKNKKLLVVSKAVCCLERKRQKVKIGHRTNRSRSSFRENNGDTKKIQQLLFSRSGPKTSALISFFPASPSCFIVVEIFFYISALTQNNFALVAYHFFPPPFTLEHLVRTGIEPIMLLNLPVIVWKLSEASSWLSFFKLDGYTKNYFVCFFKGHSKSS